MMKKRNKFALDLFTKKYRKRVVKPKKGKGSFKRRIRSNLKEIIIQNFNTKNEKLIYVSGEIITTNLDKDLISEGYNVDRIINYKVLPVENLDLKFLEELKSSIPEIVFIYSQNSAKSFLSIIKKYELNDYWMNSNLMCMGEKTSRVLNEIKWKKIFLFNPGEEEYLLYKI